MKNYYGVSMLWDVSPSQEDLTEGETQCLEEALKNAMHLGIEEFCKNDSFYSALFEKAGLIYDDENDEQQFSDEQVEVHEGPPGMPPEQFLQMIHDLYQAWLATSEYNSDCSCHQKDLLSSTSPKSKGIKVQCACFREPDDNLSQDLDKMTEGSRMRLDDPAA